MPPTSGRPIADQIELHHRRVTLRREGTGPVVVLVHGLAGDLHTWDAVVGRLAERCTVVAPDLPGHGRSDPPAGDYSLGAYATWLRDLLDALGHERATIVGHSLGGGIAMQFAYQYPQRCARLVLVASGGLGPDVNIALRAAALPGAEGVLSLIAHPQLIALGARISRAAAALGVGWRGGLAETVRGYAGLADATLRRSFVNSVRAVVDHRGQRISALDRLHLLADVPTLIVWGTDDRIIPVAHAHAAQQAIPGSRLELFARTGHFPHAARPGRFARVLQAFLEDTAHAAASPAARLAGQLVAEPSSVA
jgi:pimeloyl-ACP methyl ester carboxylesterase